MEDKNKNKDKKIKKSTRKKEKHMQSRRERGGHTLTSSKPLRLPQRIRSNRSEHKREGVANGLCKGEVCITGTGRCVGSDGRVIASFPRAHPLTESHYTPF